MRTRLFLVRSTFCRRGECEVCVCALMPFNLVNLNSLISHHGTPEGHLDDKLFAVCRVTGLKGLRSHNGKVVTLVLAVVRVLRNNLRAS